MLRKAVSVLALLAGCFQPALDYTDGELSCDGTECPPGYHCRADGFCARGGAGLDGPVPADAPLEDGSGAEARLTISPDDADFGTVVLGMTSGDVVFTVANEGGQTSGRLTVASGGRDRGELMVVADLCSDTELRVGGTCTVKLRFIPTATGDKSATVGVSATPGGIVLATVRAKSAPAGVLTVSPTMQDFGSVLQATTGQEAAFTVRNTGADATTVHATLAHGSDFAITDDGCTGTLPALSSCVVKVQFQPHDTAALADSLVLTDGNGGTAVSGLTGQGLAAAALQLMPTDHNFGALQVGGASAPMQLTVANGGGGPTGAIMAQTSDPAAFTVDNGCTSLARGETCTVSVRFTAAEPAGERTATVTVTASPGGQATAALFGTVLGHTDLTVTPAAQDFGAMTLGTKSAATRYLVSNNGDIPVDLGTPMLAGNDLTSFVIGDNDCPEMLPGTQSCHVSVVFAPAAVGAKSASLVLGGAAATLAGTGTAQLTVAKDGTGTGSVTSKPDAISCGPTCSAGLTVGTVTLTATPDAQSDLTAWSGAGCSGTGTCTVVMDAAKSVTATFTRRAAALTVAPATQDFGAATLGTTSAPIDLTVTNNGGDTTGPLDATVNDADMSYSIVGGTCGHGTLLAGMKCTVSVRFSPKGAPGSKPATLTVSANPGGDATTSLTGSALEPGALKVTPDSKDFGSVGVGGASAETVFTLSNTGESDTGAVTVGLSDGTSFRISSNDCQGSLRAGASCHVGVTLMPAAVGIAQGVSLTATAAPGGTAVAALRGTGTAQVSVTNAGGGTVASAAKEIDCGAACSATFTSAPVILTATP
jgi:hypothetical protein